MEKHLTLDTTNLQGTYQAENLEPHEKYGVGEAYQFGGTRVELFLGTKEASPLARIRSGKNWFVFADVWQVKPLEG